MIKSILSVYGLRYPATIVYMLQSVEYQVEPYLKWYWRTADFGKVAKRRKLERTRAAKMLLLAVTAGMLIEVMLGAFLLVLGLTGPGKILYCQTILRFTYPAL